MLLGKHLFTDHHLCCRYISSYDFFGEAIIFEKDGLYHIHGGHNGYYRFKNPYFHGGHLRMDGIITEIHHDYFMFKGTLETANLSSEQEWNICPRTGIFKFSRKSHPAYWRFQESNRPYHCAYQSGGGYIDLFSEQIYE